MRRGEAAAPGRPQGSERAGAPLRGERAASARARRGDRPCQSLSSAPRDRYAQPRLLILACSATKRTDPGSIPARERYDGPLWRTLRTVDRTGLARVAFLSARLGFTPSADTPIEWYNCRMTAHTAQQMIEGGVITRWPRARSYRLRAMSGVHPGCEIGSLARHGAAPFDDVALVGGQLYIDVMRALLVGFTDMRCVTADARITVINGPIGLMRKHLRAWLLQGVGQGA